MSHAAAAFSSITLQKANTDTDTDTRQQIHLWQTPQITKKKTVAAAVLVVVVSCISFIIVLVFVVVVVAVVRFVATCDRLALFSNFTVDILLKSIWEL